MSNNKIYLNLSSQFLSDLNKLWADKTTVQSTDKFDKLITDLIPNSFLPDLLKVQNNLTNEEVKKLNNKLCKNVISSFPEIDPKVIIHCLFNNFYCRFFMECGESLEKKGHYLEAINKFNDLLTIIHKPDLKYKFEFEDEYNLNFYYEELKCDYHEKTVVSKLNTLKAIYPYIFKN